MQKSRTKHDARVSNRICAVIGACMLIVVSLPACTGGALPNARSTAQTEPPPVRQRIDVMPVDEPLALGDETSKNLPVEQNEETVGACSDALYVEEPIASGYVPVSEGLWQLCDESLAACGKACRRKRSEPAKAKCFQECNKAYSRCLQLAGLTKMTFDALDKAWSWIKDNKGKVVGTIIVVGGIAYVVSTGGSGALILIPLGA